MRIIFTLFFIGFLVSSKSQLLKTFPAFVQESSDSVVFVVDAAKGNQGLKDYTQPGDVFVHIGAITNLSANSSDWKHVPFAWATTNTGARCTYLQNNKWKYTIKGGLRAFFGITDPSEKIQKIAILFRSGDGNMVQRNSDGSDMYIPLYDSSLHIRIDEPFSEPRFSPVAEPLNKTIGDKLPITANSSTKSILKLYFNGVQIGTTAANATTISSVATISVAGAQTVIAEAKTATETQFDTLTFFVNAPVTVAPLPQGAKDGINYEPGDTSATLVLFAPHKKSVTVLADFNDWSVASKYQMNKTPDSTRYWIRITGLTPKKEYSYQYLIDGTIKVADYMTEKVLDPDNDKYIPAATYPDLKPYPERKTTGIVSVLQTAKPTYKWQVTDFKRPDKRNLIIYELLVRDFVTAKNWQTVKDSISYLKKLGVNAIEVLPFNEFEGNNSWGYNPSFYFAADKAYGTDIALKSFIDECHKQGIAVIMDMVLNHSFGSSPMVQMYFDGNKNIPAADNPWYNQYATHAYNVGYQFNHESAATKDFTQKVLAHWLTNYHIDGYRFDLAKGFTQKRTCDATGNNCNVNSWSAYDSSRVNLWDSIYAQQQQISPESYCILEMLADNKEESVYADKGMLLWGNLNYNFNQATMGYSDGWDFSWGIYKKRNWQNPALITYQESHDEERLMFKNEQYGNSAGSYNVKDLKTALNRNAMAAAFWALTPAPKMIWQFGELGYDYSINTCENGSIDEQCRTAPKPIRWDYLADTNRLALHKVYAKLFKLRNIPGFLPTFITSDISDSLAGSFKWLKVNSDSLKIMVVGNFDVVPVTGTVTFQNAGIWYNYLSGGTKVATGAPESITLQPGEYYVFLNRNVDSLSNILPLQLLGFSGSRSSDKISLNWSTTNEINIKQFDVERSYDGSKFSLIGYMPARNLPASSVAYNYFDKDEFALNFSKKIYYRLKMIDMDGKYTYSNIAEINSAPVSPRVSLYPNPIKGTQLFITVNDRMNSDVNIKVEDLSGRVINKFLLRRSNTDNTIPVNVKSLAAGIYLIKLETSNGSIIKKVIIQH